jgi:beta-lactamase superfamily II metal-dependent hydrolase
MRRRPLAALLAASLAMAFAGHASRAQDAKGLQIYFVDVMGGAATLVVTPAGETVLIDSGWPGNDDRDPRRIVHVLKEIAGRERIDHLVTTHWHTDHYGGVAGLARLVPIGRFWDRGLPEDGLEGLDFPDGPKADDPLGVAYRRASAGRRTALKPGDTLPLAGLTLRVLASGGKVVATPAGARPTAACDEVPDKAPDGSDNGRSLAFKLSAGAFDFFDAGDLTWNVEKRLACPDDLVGAIDLYQVTHHGMDISNHPTLVRTIRPTVAVMNNGPRKGGSPATVKLLKSLPGLQAFYALHKNQATGPEDNAEPALTANPDPAGGRFIGVRVAPDGASYTVRLGADGPSRTFMSK